MAAKKSYRELQEQLDEVLAEMQTTELDIDRASELFTKGQKLLTELENYLQTAKNEIVRLTK